MSWKNFTRSPKILEGIEIENEKTGIKMSWNFFEDQHC